MEQNLKIAAQKQSDIVTAAKHLLSMARAGRIAALGYAVVNVDDDGDLAVGTNAVWTDEKIVQDALRETIGTLSDRISQKTRSIILVN